MKIKIITSFIIFIIFFSTYSFGFYTTLPVWNEQSDIIEVNAEESKDNFLNLESESAILIEQTTRRNFI